MSFDTDLNNRITTVVGFDMMSHVERIRKLSIQHDMLRAAVELLDDEKKIILNQQMEKYRAEFAEKEEKVTEKRLESLAIASEEYHKHCEAIKDARIDLAGVAGDYYAARNSMEVARSQLAFARQEMQMENGYKPKNDYKPKDNWDHNNMAAHAVPDDELPF